LPAAIVSIESHSLSFLDQVRIWMRRLPWAGLIIFCAACAALLLTIPMPGEQRISLTMGEVAPQDIVASHAIVFISDVLTKQMREAAASQVSAVFAPPDPHIARMQVEHLRTALFDISVIRADPILAKETKRDDITQIKQIQLLPDSAAQILQLSDLEWQVVTGEAEAVLERTMRQSIRPDQLEGIRNSLPAYISLTLPEAQASLVTDLVRTWVVPNSLYDPTATQILRAQASAAVIPVTRSYAPGQVVVTRGQLVTAADLEAMRMLGYISGALDMRTAGSNVSAVLLISVLLILAAAQFHPELGKNFRLAFVLGMVNLLFIAGARLMIPGHIVLPFLFPSVALAIVMATFFGPAFGILNGLLLSLLTGLIAGSSLEIALCGGIGSLVGVLTLRQGEKPLRYFAAGMTAALAEVAVVLVIRLREPATDLTGILTLVGACLMNGVLSGSLAFALLVTIGNLFDITTNLQLLDLSRPDHPLLRLILREAPGTYQHSLQVANLAESAGERIHANTLLLRVGALFHDCGKAMRPKLFVENQGAEINPHTLLDPATSAKVILQHTRDGMDLARKYRLPTRVRNLIPEHHGTLRTNFQYGLALKAAGGDAAQVDEAAFHYAGPRPQSKEAAVLMLADGVEAKFRAVSPTTGEDIDSLVRQVIDDRLSQHQFDETNLTLSDLEDIRLSFCDTLRGTIHPRLRYPEDDPKLVDVLAGNAVEKAV
jgi:cyclic-di-AMP phosphodiesterase PgpH